jgi:serine/threonine protein kinase
MSSPLLSKENNYEEKFLKAGAYGAVFRITSKTDQKKYAMKQTDLKNIPKPERQAALNEAMNEYKLYKRNIPNVLRSYGSYFDKTNEIYRFSVDLMEMDLSNFIEKNGGALTFEEFTPIFSDIIKGKLLSECPL